MPYDTEKIREVEPDNEFEIAALQYFKDSIRTMTNLNAALPEILGKVSASDVMTRTLAAEMDNLKGIITRRDDRTRVTCIKMYALSLFLTSHSIAGHT